MTRRDWKRERATSAVHAMRLCKEFARERRQLSVERIAERMGTSEESLYKWLSMGRMPLIVIPTYELVCGANYISVWLASTAGKLVIDMPTGRKASSADVVEINTSCAKALPLLTAFYEDPAKADLDATLAALREHLELAAFHHRNVAQYQAPQLEF